MAQISNLILDKKAKESGEPSPLGNMLLKRLPVQFTLGGANSSRGGGKSTIYEIKEDHLSITNNQDWLNERITEFEENVLGPARSDRKRFLVKAWGPLLKPVLAKHEVFPLLFNNHFFKKKIRWVPLRADPNWSLPLSITH